MKQSSKELDLLVEKIGGKKLTKENLLAIKGGNGNQNPPPPPPDDEGIIGIVDVVDM